MIRWRKRIAAVVLRSGSHREAGPPPLLEKSSLRTQTEPPDDDDDDDAVVFSVLDENAGNYVDYAEKRRMEMDSIINPAYPVIT